MAMPHLTAKAAETITQAYLPEYKESSPIEAKSESDIVNVGVFSVSDLSARCRCMQNLSNSLSMPHPIYSYGLINKPLHVRCLGAPKLLTVLEADEYGYYDAVDYDCTSQSFGDLFFIQPISDVARHNLFSELEADYSARAFPLSEISIDLSPLSEDKTADLTLLSDQYSKDASLLYKVLCLQWEQSNRYLLLQHVVQSSFILAVSVVHGINIFPPLALQLALSDLNVRCMQVSKFFQGSSNESIEHFAKHFHRITRGLFHASKCVLWLSLFYYPEISWLKLFFLFAIQVALTPYVVQFFQALFSSSGGVVCRLLDTNKIPACINACSLNMFEDRIDQQEQSYFSVFATGVQNGSSFVAVSLLSMVSGEGLNYVVE